MNQAFRTIWSKVRSQIVVVSEAAGSQATRKKAGVRAGTLTAAAAAVMAATLGSAEAAVDTSAWTVTGTEYTIEKDIDLTGGSYGRIQSWSGSWDTEPDTNKATLAEGYTMTGGVYGYDADDDENFGQEGTDRDSGLLRYHTFIVNGTLKDAETYHDVATNADKAQVGTINWFNRLAVGATGTVNVQEIRVAEALVNEGNLTVGDLYTKSGSSFTNTGTLMVNGDFVLGSTKDIFDSNVIDVGGTKYNGEVETVGKFTNTGTVQISGYFMSYQQIDSKKANIKVSKTWQSYNDVSVNEISGNCLSIVSGNVNSKSVKLSQLNVGGGTLKVEKLEVLGANQGAMSVSGIIEVGIFESNQNYFGTGTSKLLITGSEKSAEINSFQISGTGSYFESATNVVVNQSFIIGNQDGGLLHSDLSVGTYSYLTGNLTVEGSATFGGDVNQSGTATINNLFTANAALNNRGSLKADNFVVKGVTDNQGGSISSLGSDLASEFGEVTNKAEINLAGTSVFGAVNNSGTITLAKDSVMDKLTQTAGSTTALGNLALNLYGVIYGSLKTTKQLSAQGIYNLGEINVGSAHVDSLHNGVCGATSIKGLQVTVADDLVTKFLENIGSIVVGSADIGELQQYDSGAYLEFTDAEATHKIKQTSTTKGTIKSAGDFETDVLYIEGQGIFLKNLTVNSVLGVVNNQNATVTVSGTLNAVSLQDNLGVVSANEVILHDGSSTYAGRLHSNTNISLNKEYIGRFSELIAPEDISASNNSEIVFVSGTSSAKRLILNDSRAMISGGTMNIGELVTTGASMICSSFDLKFKTASIGDGLTYVQSAGSFTTEDGSFFQNSTLNISGGTLDRTGATTRAAGANTLGIGNTVNISGSTAGTFTDQSQVGSHWKDGQTVVSVGLLNSDSTVTVKSGGVLETGNIELTSNTLHFDGGAVSASLVNFFDGVSEKVYKITDGSETAVTTNVLGAADVTDVKDSFKDNIDFTANGGTIVVTDAAVSLKAIASASEKLKATAGENADKVNVVFTGQAAGSSGTLTGFYYNTYTELAAEQGQTSHFKDPGVVFATMAFENRAEEGAALRDKLVVGTATAADDTYVLSDSIGFARVDGSDNVTVNGGKTFALVGGAEGTNLLNTAAGTLTVTGADSKFVMGTKGVAGTEGVLGTLNVTESGAMNVAMGMYTVTNLNLTSGTGSTDAGTTLMVAKLADDAASSFTNAGTLSITSADALKAAYENSGNFNVASNTVLQNTFTNSAGRAVFAGTVEMQKAVTNAKDATIKTAGFTVSSALTGANGNMINNAGRLESTGANTVAGSLMVAKDGALVATDVTNITTGRINVLGDSHFKEVNIGVAGNGALGAGDGALIHADSITVGSMGQLRLRDGATVVAKNLKVDGMMSAGSVTWALGSAAVNGWDNKNADRLSTIMGEYGTTTAMLYALSSRAAYGFARFNADVVKDGTDHSEVSDPAADAVIVDGDDARYVIDIAKTDGFSMTIDSPSDLTTKGNVFSADARTNFTVALGSITVHNDADVTMNDAAYLLEGKNFTIEEGGSVTVENTQDDAGYHPGVMVVRGNLVNAGEMNSAAGAGLIVAGNGIVTVSGKDTGKTLVVTDDGTYKVAGGEADYAGLQLKGGTLDVASGWFGYGLAKADAGYMGDKSAVFATSLNTIETGDSRVIVGTVADGDTVTSGSVYFGVDSALVLNTSNLVDKTLFKGNDTGTFTVKTGSELAVSHTTWGKHYILGEGYDLSGVEDGAWQGDAVKNLTGDEMELAVTRTDDGKLILSAGRDTTADDSTSTDPANPGNGGTTDPTQPDTSIRALSRDYATPDIIDDLINNDANIGLRDPNSEKADIAFIERVLDKNYVGTTADGQLDVKKATRLWNSVVELSAASGATAYTLSQATDAMGMIEDRAAGLDQINGQSSNLWVKPLGKYAKADKLKADGSMTGGFEATTTGIMGGFDLSNKDFTLGLAASYGKGSLKSRGDWTATDTKVEAVGVNAYGAVRQGKAALIGHVGYMKSKGEAKQSFTDNMLNAHSVKGDIKNQVFTAGLRGELAFEVSDSVTVTPHFGLRYVKTKTDGYDITMNGKSAFKAGKAEGDLWQVPLGVGVKADFVEDAWHVSPFADVSVVRQFGDTDMKTTVSATSFEASDSFRADVVGKTMGEIKLGINAELKNHSFGVSYTGSVGTQGTQNHSLSANYRYRF